MREQLHTVIPATRNPDQHKLFTNHFPETVTSAVADLDWSA